MDCQPCNRNGLLHGQATKEGRMGLKLFKEPCKEVEDLYKKETGRNHYYGENFTALPSLLYVEWLEKKS